MSENNGMGEGVNVESIMEEATFLAGLFQQIVADCKVFLLPDCLDTHYLLLGLVQHFSGGASTFR